MESTCFLKILVISLIFTSCKNEDTKNSVSDSYEKGKTIYESTCISCHNIDPQIDGVLAPRITDINYNLIESMIMTGKLPVGVAQKWPGAKMAPLPYLEKHIPDLYEYLKTFK